VEQCSRTVVYALEISMIDYYVVTIHD
jgi:hypothetical protein